MPLDGLELSVRYRATNLTELIGRAMLASVPDAQAAIFNSGSIRVDDVLGPGNDQCLRRIQDFPYPGGKVVRAELEGSLLIASSRKGSRSLTREGSCR